MNHLVWSPTIFARFYMGTFGFYYLQMVFCHLQKCFTENWIVFIQSFTENWLIRFVFTLSLQKSINFGV